MVELNRWRGAEATLVRFVRFGPRSLLALQRIDGDLGFPLRFIALFVARPITFVVFVGLDVKLVGTDVLVFVNGRAKAFDGSGNNLVCRHAVGLGCAYLAQVERDSVMYC